MLIDRVVESLSEATTERITNTDGKLVTEQAQAIAAVDRADAIAYAVTRPWHVCLNEILIRPTEQTG